MSPRTPNMNYITPDPHETAASDLDYFVWLIRGRGRKILVDTGFNAEEAALRSRKLTLNPAEALTRFGVGPEAIDDVIVTHLHYDHAGNLDLFPRARFHLQDRELRHRALHVLWRTASSVFGRARDADGAPCLRRTRDLSRRRGRSGSGRHGASCRWSLRRLAGGAG